MKKILAATLAVLLLAQTAVAEEAPAPRKMPRTPVGREALPDRKPSLPSSHIVQGSMTVVDTERLRLGDLDLRLFGIVPPQLSASFGPQARAVLDNLTANQTVTCLVRDRDQAGRFLATCQNANNNDLAVELLRRGLAITARGSLSSTELVAPYIAAEQGAQAQKAGLWSVITPAAAPIAEKVVPGPTPALQPPAVIEAKKEIKEDKSLKAAAEKDALQAKASAALPASTLAPTAIDEEVLPDNSGGFIRRYQILVTGLVMLVTALSILGVLSSQRRREKQDEMKAIAAALRGELMAARAVCQGRLKSITADAEDKSVSWPRIRASLYQAYVGRLGFLGAELARQVASIYGQASDYSSYYNTAATAEASQDGSSKRQALQTLVQHIEEVLPKLALVEQTGHVGSGLSSSAFMPAPVRSISMPVVERMPAEFPAENVVSEVTSSRPSAAPLWEAVRKIRDKLKEKEGPASPEESDYASIIEAEMANLSFSEMGDDSESLPGNVTKIRNTGT